jgi:ArsR family transcriptional regulator
MAKKKIPEVRYRASRICRALGNPTAYEIMHLLARSKRTPEQLAHVLGVSVPTVSQSLRVLRNLDLVRYEVHWRRRYYWLKTDMIAVVMSDCERLIRTIERLA